MGEKNSKGDLFYGPVKDRNSNEWRIRTNNELAEFLFQKLNILEIIRSKRLKWAGHTWRSHNPLLL